MLFIMTWQHLRDEVSDAYTMEQLNISWRPLQPITMNAQLRLPDMQITDVVASYCDGTYIHGKLDVP